MDFSLKYYSIETAGFPLRKHRHLIVFNDKLFIMLINKRESENNKLIKKTFLRGYYFAFILQSVSSISDNHSVTISTDFN